MYEDYFDILLKDGRMFRWKNFGQAVTVGNDDLRKQPVKVSGAVIDKKEFEDIEVLEEYHWFVDAMEFGYGEQENIISIHLPHDKIIMVLNNEYQSRSEQYPERDWFEWINGYKLYGEFKERLGANEEKTLTYLTNWRRPKLKTNARVKVVVYHNDEPIYVGMLDGDNKKSSVDAFFRMIYQLQFLHGDNDVR